MKYCLSSRLSPRYLQKADEIKVDYRDRTTIPDLIKRYKDKTYILLIPSGIDVDWKEIQNYNLMCEENFILNCNDLKNVAEAKSRNIKFMLNTEATSYWELAGLEKLGAYYAYVGIPLFFDLDETLNFNIKLRTVPTVAYNHALPHMDGICGQWIRPEDIETYDPYIETFEFEPCATRREEILFRTYAEAKNWATRLDILVEDLNSPAINRLIDPTLAEKRIRCRQRCAQNSNYCHRCYTALEMANSELMNRVVDTPIENK